MWAVNLEAAKINIEEAERIGKCPWCCCGITEDWVYARMNPVIEKEGQKYQLLLYPQETFEESQRRWLKEGRIKKLPTLLIKMLEEK